MPQRPTMSPSLSMTTLVSLKAPLAEPEVMPTMPVALVDVMAPVLTMLTPLLPYEPVALPEVRASMPLSPELMVPTFSMVMKLLLPVVAGVDAVVGGVKDAAVVKGDEITRAVGVRD